MKFTSGGKLAEYEIAEYIRCGCPPKITARSVAETLQAKGASFVTVYVKGCLRGCIGNAEAVGPLWKSIAENAVYAATSDRRFMPIRPADLPDLKAEVTVLTPLAPYRPKDNAELLAYLTREKPGLAIAKSGRSALFLPQVWQELPEPQEFLIQLCRKAGLSDDDWKEGMEFRIFRKDERFH